MLEWFRISINKGMVYQPLRVFRPVTSLPGVISAQWPKHWQDLKVVIIMMVISLPILRLVRKVFMRPTVIWAHRDVPHIIILPCGYRWKSWQLTWLWLFHELSSSNPGNAIQTDALPFTRVHPYPLDPTHWTHSQVCLLCLYLEDFVCLHEALH